MYTYPSAQYAVPAPIPLDSQSIVTNDEEDFRVWKFSKFAFTALLFLLFLFSTLLCLTIWQSHSDIKDLQQRLPRDLQFKVTSDEQEAGIKRYKRDVRFVVCVFAILLPCFAFIVYLGPFGVFRSMLNYILAFLLFLVFILALVQFALDANSERDARECEIVQYSSTTSQKHCESREALATCLPIFDGLVALFSIVAAYQLVVFSKSGDWTRATAEKDTYAPDPLVPGLAPNGISCVRKTVTSLVLFSLLACGIALLVFTVLIHESRTAVAATDSNNRVQNNQAPGWPRRNSAMRYAVCGAVILTILFNFIPLESRVIAFVLAFVYLVCAILSFSAFALDVDSLDDAKDELKNPCNFPSPHGTVECAYHPYRATATLDFLGGLFLIVYVVMEYFVLRVWMARIVQITVRNVKRADE